MTHPPQAGRPRSRPARTGSKVVGYGGLYDRRSHGVAKPRAASFGAAEIAAWLATSALALALILLLASFEVLLALPVFLAYALFSVFLWRSRTSNRT